MNDTYKKQLINFGIYFLSGLVQITIILSAEIVAELTFSRGAWVPAGIIIFVPIYVFILFLINLYFILKKNKKCLKIINIGFLLGIIIELSGLYTPLLFYTFGLCGTIYNVSVFREILGALW